MKEEEEVEEEEEEVEDEEEENRRDGPKNGGGREEATSWVAGDRLLFILSSPAPSGPPSPPFRLAAFFSLPLLRLFRFSPPVGFLLEERFEFWLISLIVLIVSSLWMEIWSTSPR